MFTWKKGIVLGCGAALLVAVGLVAVIGLFLAHVSKDVEGVGVTVDSPVDVAPGETFELKVMVTNQRPRKPLMLSDVDLGEEYLAGFTVASVEPPPKSSTHVPIDNSRSFTFDVQIPPGTSRTFTFRLRAERPGLYRGDVDVCEGLRFVTGMAQTVVKE